MEVVTTAGCVSNGVSQASILHELNFEKSHSKAETRIYVLLDNMIYKLYCINVIVVLLIS